MDDHASYSAPSTPAPSTNNELTAPPLSTSPVPDSSFTYKMTEEDILQFVKLRVSNRALFTGKRHSARVAWRQILTEMGLQRKMTPLQARKKWDNLVSKYKMIHEQELRAPRPGSGSNPQTDWPRYKFMDDAMQGRLDDSAKKLPITDAAAAYAGQLVPRKPRKRGWPPRPGSRASMATKKATTSSSVGLMPALGLMTEHDNP
ncbi:uncharacterized protein LOC134464768 [Engraulis encrasicolus]|uniref:uncharacterized protein LOC134464768 n=1 Tax=Engraulis encrasicolus TaxID=184585 RepID=UPI002FD62942